MRIVLLILCVFLLQQKLRAQEAYSAYEAKAQEFTGEELENMHDLVAPGALETTKAYQQEEVTTREFDKAKWKAIVGETDYNEVPVERESDSAPLSLPWAGPLLKVISYVVITAVVLLLLYYITNNITFDRRIQRTKLQSDDLDRPVENIEELDIAALLEQAKREGNFKMAVRLYYLRLLKKLNALGMITWKKDKTNRDYLSELFLKDFYYREMQKLTVSYEAVWYGERVVHSEAFQRLTEQFEAVFQKIDTPKAP